MERVQWLIQKEGGGGGGSEGSVESLTRNFIYIGNFG